MLTALLRLVGWCQHRELYREHREIAGRVVACYCCVCGFATPVLKRTDEEYAHLERIASPARPGRV